MKKILILVVLLMSCDSDSNSKKSEYDKGVEFYQAGDFQSALVAFEKHSSDKPRNKELETMNGISWSKLKLSKENSQYLTEAKVGFESILNSDDENEDAKYGFALISFAQKSDLSDALIETVSILDDDNYSMIFDASIDEKYVHLIRAEIYFYLKQYTNAYDEVGDIYSILGQNLSVSPSDSDFIFSLSVVIEDLVSDFTTP